MKRAGLLHCVDLEVPRFNLLRQRDQLPFHVASNEQAAKWGDFSLQDAFRLRLMLDLIADGGKAGYPEGLGPTYAAKVAVNATPLTVAEVAAASSEIWVGVAGFVGTAKGGGEEASQAHFCGPVSALGDWIASETGKWDDAYQGFSASRLFLANASRAAKFVLGRALLLGLPEGQI